MKKPEGKVALVTGSGRGVPAVHSRIRLCLRADPGLWRGALGTLITVARRLFSALIATDAVLHSVLRMIRTSPEVRSFTTTAAPGAAHRSNAWL